MRCNMDQVKFDFNTPFTMAEFCKEFGMGSPQDPAVTKRVSEALRAKGYTTRFYKRGKRWAKWSERLEVALPNIP